jgi:hypothetical protein
MYYDLSNEAKTSSKTDTSLLSIGPLYITPQQVYIPIFQIIFLNF